MPLVVSLWGVGVWHRRRMRLRFGNIENLEAISRISHSGHAWMRGALFAASLILMTLGLAYPRMVLRELRPIPTPTDLVFLLDISPSMYARDMSPSRLGRAEEIIQKFIVMKQPEDRYGLVVFNWGSAVLSYLTSDPQSILVYFDYLNQQNEPQPGTNMGAALTGGLKLLDTEEKLNPGSLKGRRDGVRDAFRRRRHGQANGKASARAGEGGHQGLHLRVGHGQRRLRAVGDARGPRRTGGTVPHLRQRRRPAGQQRGGSDVAPDRRDFRGQVRSRGERSASGPGAGGNSDSGPADRRLHANPVREDLYRYFLAAAFGCLVAGIFL